MIGWMHNWENYMTPKEFGWSGMMTIPRELCIRDGKLIQNPIREIINYYEDTIEYKEIKVDNKIALKGIEGRELDMTVDLIEGNCKKFNIFVAQDEEYQTLISYEPSKELLTFDRNYSGTTQDTIYLRKMCVKNRDSKITLRILLDKYSVEIFVNEGEQAMTSVIFTPVKVKGITFCTEGGSAKMNIIKHRIKI
jgi:beta-fructofuranosidase